MTSQIEKLTTWANMQQPGCMYGEDGRPARTLSHLIHRKWTEAIIIYIYSSQNEFLNDSPLIVERFTPYYKELYNA